MTGIDGATSAKDRAAGAAALAGHRHVASHRRTARRRSPPRPRVLRRHHPVGQPAAAVQAPEAQLDQRHVALARIDETLQVSLALMATRLAPDQHARSPRRASGFVPK